MKFVPVQQGTAAWYELRLGRPSASNFHRIVTPKGEPSKQAVKYAYRLVAERLLRETSDDQLDSVRWVEWGKSNEMHAAAAFEYVNDLPQPLGPGGIVMSDDNRIVASPDRIFRDRMESVEIKCPAPWTMVEYLLDGMGDDYKPQVQGQMLVGEFKAVHFYAWHPQMPPFHRVTLPDTRFIATLRSALSVFCDALDVMTERARSIGAYAVVRRSSTPADLAYQDEGDAQLQIIDPNIGWVP